nr:PREDICTED: protein GOS9-like [Musa acuminata subsp. malaccensis]
MVMGILVDTYTPGCRSRSRYKYPHPSPEEGRASSSSSSSSSCPHTHPYLQMAGEIKVGAWGGDGGSAWDMAAAYRITNIKFRAGDAIDGIVITFTRYGQTETKSFGGTGGKLYEIPLQEDEYLVGVEGSVDTMWGITLVRNLTLRTNKKSYGPFGTSGGKPFSVPVASGKIIGFFGRAGAMIDAIGVYLAPK